MANHEEAIRRALDKGDQEEAEKAYKEYVKSMKRTNQRYQKAKEIDSRYAG